jgi:hypothetical protein
MVASYTRDEDGKFYEIVMKIEEDGSILSKCIQKEEHNQNFVVRKDDATLSHTCIQGKDYTQLVNAIVGIQLQEPIVTTNKSKLTYERSHEKEEK